MSLVSVNLEDLAEVVGLACLAEARTNAEQRALLKVARNVDKAWNTTMNAKTWERLYHVEGHPSAARLLRDLSFLEIHADRSRCLEDDDRRVKLPEKGRWTLDKNLHIVNAVEDSEAPA